MEYNYNTYTIEDDGEFVYFPCENGDIFKMTWDEVRERLCNESRYDADFIQF